jgi:hypothetical protein
MPLCEPVCDPETNSNRAIDLIEAYAAGRRGVSAEEAWAWTEDLRARDPSSEYLFSLNRYVFHAHKP